MKTALQVGFAIALVAGAGKADTLALVAADSAANELAAQQAFQATNKFTSVTIIDTQTSTPDLATLSTFSDVLAWTAAAPADRAALGNVLAAYYDLGGKHLTIATYAFSTVVPVPPFNLPNPELQGRIITSPYAALTNAGVNGDSSGMVAAVAPTDPIFSGIDLTSVFYAENQYFAQPGLASGATLLATDGGMAPVNLLARSANGVVNVNLFPGGPQGTTLGNNNPALFNLLVNTFVSVTPTPAAKPAAPTANPGGPYTFCTDSKPWLLDGTHSVDPEQGRSDSGKPADQIIHYGWNLNGTGPFSDAAGAQPDVTAFYTKLGPGTYSAQLQVTASTAASFPSSGLANLTGTASTQVTITSGCSCITNLAAAVTTNGQIRLTWATAGANHYGVYRGTTTGGPYKLLAAVPGSATPDYLDRGVVAGTTYYYVVRPMTLTGTAACQSNEAQASTAADKTPPTTTAHVEPEPNGKGWNRTWVNVGLFAEDNQGGSGVKQISVTLSGAQTGSKVIAGRFALIPVTAEGVTTVTYFSTDNAGNAESTRTLTVMIDKTDPTVTAKTNPPLTGTSAPSGPVTVTFTGTDTLSGIRECTAPITLNASGKHTAVGFCVDNAGNVSKPAVVTLNSGQSGSTGGSTGGDHDGDHDDPGKH